MATWDRARANARLSKCAMVNSACWLPQMWLLVASISMALVTYSILICQWWRKTMFTELVVLDGRVKKVPPSLLLVLMTGLNLVALKDLPGKGLKGMS